MIITSPHIGELAEAMAKAQAELENPTKEKENTFFKNNKGVASKYADLAAGLDCIRPALSAQSIALFQVTSIDRDNSLILHTRLVHGPSGQWIEAEYFVCKADLDHQKRGSALTYAKRQSLFALVGIAGADDDDDGNSATITSNGTTAITATQAKLIRDKIISIGADEAKFLEYFKSKSVEELRSNEFRMAMIMLDAKKGPRDIMATGK